MFLTNLNSTQKDAFMALAQNLISADGILDERETATIEQYKLEMNLPSSYQIIKIDQSEAISVLSEASKVVRRQIAFELIALALIDKNYTIEEQTLLKNIQTSFVLEDTFADCCKVVVSELSDLYARIRALIDE